MWTVLVQVCRQLHFFTVYTMTGTHTSTHTHQRTNTHTRTHPHTHTHTHTNTHTHTHKTNPDYYEHKYLSIHALLLMCFYSISGLNKALTFRDTLNRSLHTAGTIPSSNGGQSLKIPSRNKTRFVLALGSSDSPASQIQTRVTSIERRN